MQNLKLSEIDDKFLIFHPNIILNNKLNEDVVIDSLEILLNRYYGFVNQNIHEH
jgi:hypothetical protein